MSWELKREQELALFIETPALRIVILHRLEVTD